MIQIPKDFHNPVRLLEELKIKPEEYWIRRGEKRVLGLFHQMAERVPAYKYFLKKHNFRSDLVKTIQDFKEVPLIDKANYLRAYPLKDLCWDGKLGEKRWVISATSGSSGEPFYFPRQDDQDWQYAVIAEMYLRNNFEIHKKSTLYIDGWGMGIWIGGLFSYQAVKFLSERGDYMLSIVTPGSSKDEIIKAVINLGHNFDQIIIGGYPPLIKDTIDDGIRRGVQWKDYSVKFIFSAEGFSEKFREYIAEKVGLKNIYRDTLNHYGTVDLGTMSHETPLSILIRRIAVEKPELNTVLFGQDYRQPTLTQFIPELFFFEEIKQQLVCSAFSGLPLVRYDLKDTGGVVSYKELVQRCASQGVDVLASAKAVGIKDIICNLPFVYVFERNDFTVKLSGANIFPEEVKKALEIAVFSEAITGKFAMIIKFNEQQDQYLEINLEMRPGAEVSPDVKESMLKSIIEQLLEQNSEYKYLYGLLPRSRVAPRLVFWEYEHPIYFKPAGKQKWKVEK